MAGPPCTCFIFFPKWQILLKQKVAWLPTSIILIEYPDKETFDRHRNKFGGLLLLPMDKNRSLNDLTFDRKLPIYFGENLLAKSLNSDCYQNNPQFKRFLENENLSFKSYTNFDKTALLERQELYEALVKKIWSVEQLENQIIWFLSSNFN